MTGTAAAAEVIADAHRREWGRVLAATVRVARDLDLAEECVQEAYASALQAWASAGIPTRDAADAYRQALALAANDAERAFLHEQVSAHTDRA
jgi:predicted RNA polymerase sigma factor